MPPGAEAISEVTALQSDKANTVWLKDPLNGSEMEAGELKGIVAEAFIANYLFASF